MKLKITYTLDTVLELTDEAADNFVEAFVHFKEHGYGLHLAGMQVGAIKTAADAPYEEIVQNMLAEEISQHLSNVAEDMFKKGVEQRVKSCTYHETPEKLDPPSDAVPQVIDLRK